MAGLRALHAWIGKIETVVAGSFLVSMVVLVFAGALGRMAGHPLNWTMDVATCFFAWSCFLCADIAWRRDSLMSIELLTQRLPETTREFLVQLNHVLIGLFLVYVVYAGLWLSWVSRARSFQGIPGVSYSWVTMSLPVGAMLLLLTTLLKFADNASAVPSSKT